MAQTCLRAWYQGRFLEIFLGILGALCGRRGGPWYGASAQPESHFGRSSPRCAPQVLPSMFPLNYFWAFLGGGDAPGTVPFQKPQVTPRKACLRTAKDQIGSEFQHVLFRPRAFFIYALWSHKVCHMLHASYHGTFPYSCINTNFLYLKLSCHVLTVNGMKPLQIWGSLRNRTGTRSIGTVFHESKQNPNHQDHSQELQLELKKPSELKSRTVETSRAVIEPNRPPCKFKFIPCLSFLYPLSCKEQLSLHLLQTCLFLNHCCLYMYLYLLWEARWFRK